MERVVIRFADEKHFQNAKRQQNSLNFSGRYISPPDGECFAHRPSEIAKNKHTTTAEMPESFARRRRENGRGWLSGIFGTKSSAFNVFNKYSFVDTINAVKLKLIYVIIRAAVHENDNNNFVAAPSHILGSHAVRSAMRKSFRC